MIAADPFGVSFVPTRRALLAACFGLAAVPVARAAVVGADLLPSAGDRTADFVAGLTRAVAEKRPFVLAPGTFQIGPVQIPDGAQIVGTAGLTTLVAGGDGTLMTGRSAKRIVLSGLAIDGRNRAGAAPLLVFADVGELRLVDCVVGRASDVGLLLDRCGGRIEKCTFAAIGVFGILARDSRALTITDNTVVDCGDGGILVHRGEPGEDGSVVSGNRVERIRARSGGTGQVGNGINIYRAHGVAITGNRVLDCAFSGIRVNGGSNVRIAGNEVTRSGETALYVEFEFQGAVIADNIVDGAVNGISVVNSQQGGRLATVTGNVVRNLKPATSGDPKTPAFGIAVEADTAVTGNVIEGAPHFGMMVGWGEYLRNITIVGNVVREAGVGIAVSVVERAGSTVIVGNVFQATKRGAVVGYRWGDAATGDLALPGASVPSHLTVDRNRVAP